jgi:hypothetical protein
LAALIGRQGVRQANRETDRQTEDRQTVPDRQTYSRTGRKTDFAIFTSTVLFGSFSGSQAGMQSGRQSGRMAGLSGRQVGSRDGGQKDRRKVGRKAGRQGGRNAGGQEFRQTDKCTERQMCKYTHRHTEIKTYRNTQTN